MCSSTYPNFASIVTGRLPVAHGIFANMVVGGDVILGAADVGPRVATFVDQRTEVVVGDHNLIGVTAASTAGRHWPTSGVTPPGAGADAFGYLADTEVTGRVVEALERRPEVLFVQLNGPDTVAHIHGPDSNEAIESYREIDRCLAIIDEAVHWDQDLVMVTSDHDQEPVSPSLRIDLDAVATREGAEVSVVHEGTAAMLVGPGASDGGWLAGVDGVEGWGLVAEDVSLAFSAPGWWFSDSAFPDFKGAHGGPRTRSTLAVAAGSSSPIEAIRDRFMAPRLGAEDWSGLVKTARTA